MNSVFIVLKGIDLYSSKFRIVKVFSEENMAKLFVRHKQFGDDNYFYWYIERVVL